MKKPKSTSKPRAIPPFETGELRKGIKVFMNTPFEEGPETVGSFRWGIYVFYDYDGEPIYVGQTYEGLSSRVGRHLTNQRTDAVAMSVLDPFEVFEIEVFPLPHLSGVNSKHPDFKNAKAELNRLELEIFQRCVQDSAFKRVLNEKDPAVVPTTGQIPKGYRGRIVSDDVAKIRKGCRHTDSKASPDDRPTGPNHLGAAGRDWPPPDSFRPGSQAQQPSGKALH